MHSVLSIEKPASALPVVFDSPHSGAEYPDDFLYACPFAELQKAEDTYVDDLFSEASAHGASMLKALFPRSYIDANRAGDDIDPEILEGDWPTELHGPINPTTRSASGIGLIRRLVRPGLPVYDRRLAASEIMARIENYYRPYHAALKDLLDEAHYNYGQVWHINCHSMPASTAVPHKPHSLYLGSPRGLDIVLGDRNGSTAGREFVHSARAFLEGLGYRIGLNDPFKGAELVKLYSAPTRGRHSLQIEINKALYMDEKTGERSSNFANLKDDLTKFIAFCTEQAKRQQRSLAAD